jgi:hypothetical protein
MDTLTFNSPIILRHLTFSEARKLPIDVIRLDLALEGLELNMDQVSRQNYHTLLLTSADSLFCSVHRHVHPVRL